MTRPRSQLICLETTPYYHCIARCVRRSWLCGNDRYSGMNFDHRKPWVIERLKLLAEVFAIDIAAYAVMSNHYHVVLHVDVGRGMALTNDEVIQNWTRLFTGPKLVQRYKAGLPITGDNAELLDELVARWRQRLCSISWFMRCLNEYLARRANAEDGCKGRFWEARFKSQALLDESALLSCMTYVDLNPVRAGIAADLEEGDFTSIQDRIRAIKIEADQKVEPQNTGKPRLMPFLETLHEQQTFAGIPFNLKDYLELVDWTGRAIRPDKKGHIDQNRPLLLASLGISATDWTLLALEIQKQAITMLHGINKLNSLRKRKSSRLAA